MNILQEIDSTLHYENIEKAWHKFKYYFVLALIALFGGVAGFNTYNSSVENKANHDADIIFNYMYQKESVDNAADLIIPALDELKTQQAKDMISLELAKTYAMQNKTEDYIKLLEELNSSNVKTVKELSIYMLAEAYLAQDAAKTVEFIDSVKLSKKATTYALVQELKAMALVKLEKLQEAKEIFTVLVADPTLAADVKARVQIKLDQLG